MWREKENEGDMVIDKRVLMTADDGVAGVVKKG